MAGPEQLGNVKRDGLSLVPMGIDASYQIPAVPNNIDTGYQILAVPSNIETGARLYENSDEKHVGGHTGVRYTPAVGQIQHYSVLGAT